MTARRKAVQQVHTQVAAFHFVFTSRDGMEICRLLQIAPWKMHKIATSREWGECLDFWRYEGSPVLQGEDFNKAIGVAQMEQGFRWAWRRWKALFGGDA